jgi:hypothetical protein
MMYLVSFDALMPSTDGEIRRLDIKICRALADHLGGILAAASGFRLSRPETGHFLYPPTASPADESTLGEGLVP